MTVTAADLRSLPKVELHVHLEGTVSADTARQLAERHGEDPRSVLVLEGDGYAPRFRDFTHFVETFVATARQVRRPEDLRTVAAAFARTQAEQGVLYTEATFTAVSLVDNGWEPEAMWEAIRAGFAEEPGVTVGLIVDAVRDAGVGHAERTVELVEAADAPIVGLGLAGIEGSLPERDFTVLREAADRLGLGLAVHAGENGTPDNIRAALDDLGADRIGHGVAVMQDRALMGRLARDGVPLEVCPSSNVRLGIFDTLEQHPFPAMWEAGLNVVIGSDDPPFFSTTITDELDHAARLAGLRRHDLADLQRRAARAAFTTPAQRQQLLDAIDAWDGGLDP